MVIDSICFRRHLGGFLLFLALAVAGATGDAADEVVPGIMRYMWTPHTPFRILFLNF